MKKSNILISALSPLKPVNIWNTLTGEQVGLDALGKDIESVTSFVQSEATRVFAERTEQVIEDATALKGSANSYGRQKGYKSNYLTLPREVLAKSRINELFLYKLMSEVSSYAKNDNPKKEHPSFPKTLNLGAVDKQMASLSRDGKTLTLLWKCWATEYLIEFEIPSYVLNRDINKFSLPLIRSTHQGYDFIFTVQENIPALPKSKNSAGIDLGRVEPYTLAVVNKKGNRIAHYTTGGRLKELNYKREQILKHKKNVLAKISHFEKLGLDTSVLTTEKNRLATKAKILGGVVAKNIGAEVAQRLAKHHLNTLNVEDLSWVKGPTYGSKWNHSRQQEAITHALLRNGVRVKKVSPKNSSQLCHACGTTLTHTGRSVRCGDCQHSLDRDLNASLNLATKNHLKKRYPSLKNRLAGDNYSPTGQVIDPIGHSSITKLVT